MHRLKTALFEMRYQRPTAKVNEEPAKKCRAVCYGEGN